PRPGSGRSPGRGRPRRRSRRRMRARARAAATHGASDRRTARDEAGSVPSTGSSAAHPRWHGHHRAAPGRRGRRATRLLPSRRVEMATPPDRRDADGALPGACRFVIIGAGIHGLSTAWHLATALRARGQGDGSDVLVVDKTGVGAGASGIACGVVRNNYFQPAMRRLMAHSVDVWETDPAGFSYHPVGYLQIGPDAMRTDVRQIFAEQQAIGYPSTFVEGERETREYLQELFPEWRAEGVTCVLHEHRGGCANNLPSLRGLAAKASAAGVRVRTGVTVT